MKTYAWIKLLLSVVNVVLVVSNVDFTALNPFIALTIAFIMSIMVVCAVIDLDAAYDDAD